MPSIGYTAEAEAWFDSLNSHKDVIADSNVDGVSRGSWMTLLLKGKGKATYNIPVWHGHPSATRFSLQYCTELPRIWERQGVKAMSILQGLEVKNRALVMGDIASSLRDLIDDKLLPSDFEGVLSIRNPYHAMTFRMVEMLESIDKGVPVVSTHFPAKWRTDDAVDKYDISAKGVGGGIQGIGLALHRDCPDVSVFDVAGSIALRDVG